jgi:iron complex outermembrane receptor protein
MNKRSQQLLLAGVAAFTMVATPAAAQVDPAPPTDQPAPAATEVQVDPAPPSDQAAPAATDPQAGPVVEAQEVKPETATEQASAEAADKDIVVTAQRRSESLQRTPVAVSVLTSESLMDRAIISQSDLQIAVPGLTVRASADSNQLNFAIRGQSLDAFSATRPGVLPYFNEVQVGGSGATAFYDLASIQVLKGPQGTLFGRNSTGGAVLFTTARPDDNFGGYILGRVGNYRALNLEGAINIPLGESAAIRVAGVRQYRRGFQRNLHPFCARPHPLFPIANDPSPSQISGDDDDSCRIGTTDRAGGRVSLRVEPTSTIRNELVVDYLHSGGSATSGVLYSINPSGLVPGLAFFNTTTNGLSLADILGPAAAAAYAAAAPFLPPGGVRDFLLLQQQRGPFRVMIDGLNRYRANNWLMSNVTTVDLSPDIKLKNVLGYTNIKSTTFSDIDGSPFGIDNNGFFRRSADGPNGRTENIRQFSEELQLLGAMDRLTYVTGLYYSNERLYNLTTSDLFDLPILRTIQFNNSITKNKTIAGYAQGTYKITGEGPEGLSARAGLRYTKEDISLDILPRDVSFKDPPAVQATYDPHQKNSFKTLSYTLGLDYQATPDLLVYASHRRGYRHGGFNNVVRPVPGLGIEGGNGYKTEAVYDVELGLKLRKRGPVPLRFNVALYNAWIKDAQRVAYTLSGGSPAAITVNVPRARVRGFESDLTVTPVDWLNIGAQLNYTDAKFTKNLVSVLGAPPVVFGTYPDTPKWSGAIYADATFPLGGDYELQVRGDVYAQTHTFFSSTANLNPGARLPGYKVANFRVGIQNEAGGWSVAGLVKNAFDRTYYVGGVALGELFQTNSAIPGEPRTFLLEARYKF